MFNKLNSIALSILLSISTGSMPSFSDTSQRDFPKIISQSPKLNLEEDAKRIAKANPLIAGLRLDRITGFESDCYRVEWFLNSFYFALLNVDIFTFGRNNIGDSIDEGVHKAFNMQVDSIRELEKKGFYRNLKLGTASTRNIGGRSFLYLPMTYSQSVRVKYTRRVLNDAKFNSVILATAIKGRYINIFISATPQDAQQKKIEQIIQEIPNLLQSL